MSKKKYKPAWQNEADDFHARNAAMREQDEAFQARLRELGVSEGVAGPTDDLTVRRRYQPERRDVLKSNMGG